MTKRNRKRAAPRVATLTWSDDLAEIFRLPCRAGLTPPSKLKITLTNTGSTWTAQFTSASGEPVQATVRLRHGPPPFDFDYDPQVVSERMDLRFVVGGLLAAGSVH